MTSTRVEKTGRAPAPALDEALERSHEVKAKVEACAEDLTAANEGVKEQIASGTSLLSAHETLRVSTTVEGQAQECADDLHEVTKTLAKGIDDLAQTEIELTESREILADRDLFDDRLSQAIQENQRHAWACDEDTVCRNGGDEFLFLLVNPQGRENTERIAGLVGAKKDGSRCVFVDRVGKESAAA